MRKYFLILLFPSIVVWGSAEISAPFFWGPYEKGTVKFEKASILLAVKGEEERYIQLDTGSDSSYAYGESERKSFSLASRDEREFIHTFNPKPEISGDKIIGTLGADFFTNKCLLIDFPRETISISDCEKEKLDQKFVWIHGSRSNFGHLLIDVVVGEHVIKNVMFDTGSSIFSLAVKEDDWKKIVVERAIEHPTHSIVVPSWGKLLTMIGADPKMPVCIQSICTSKPVYILPKEFGLENYGISGTIGNALFYDTHVLVMDFKENKLGLAPSKELRVR